MPSPSFTLALLKIAGVNLLMSAENAIAIGAVANRFPAHTRLRTLVFGMVAAVAIQIVLILFALRFLALPYVKIAGALVLAYIGSQMVREDKLAETPDAIGVPERYAWLGAVRTILIVDLSLSVDNVLAVASVAQRSPAEERLTLLALGFGISLPIFLAAARLIIAALKRWPTLELAGAALLGYIAGEMFIEDAVWSGFSPNPKTSPVLDAMAGPYAARLLDAGYWSLPWVSAVVVLYSGWWFRKRDLERRIPNDKHHHSASQIK